MATRDERYPRPGISAVMLPTRELDTAVLDLAAVLAGLVAEDFEIIVVLQPSQSDELLADLRVRAPGLPLRVVRGSHPAAGCDAARYELILVSAPDGQFDVRELNRLLDAIESGADVAAGYRPRRTDTLVRHLRRLGWHLEVDCAFELLRQRVWHDLAAEQHGRDGAPCADVLASVRKLGYVVAELPVSHRRPTIGTPMRSPAGSTRAA